MRGAGRVQAIPVFFRWVITTGLKIGSWCAVLVIGGEGLSMRRGTLEGRDTHGALVL